MTTLAHRLRRGGFTLVEILIALSLSVSVIVALLSVYVSSARSWHRTVLAIDTTREATHCLGQMVYGVGTGMGLRASYSVTNLGTATDWLLRSSNFNGVAWYDYNPGMTVVVYSNAAGSQVIGTNIVASTVTSSAIGVKIALTVRKVDGQFSGTNSVSTFVKLRTAAMR
jgi:type II secretory pathway pseudopilin PulG